MTTGTPRTGFQITEDQYVSDIAGLFRRYRLDCGLPGCLDSISRRIEEDSALRGDLFNLCTAISHMGESDLTPDELLLLVARAGGGARIADAEEEVPAELRSVFLRLYTQWLNRAWDETAPAMALGNDEASEDESGALAARIVRFARVPPASSGRAPSSSIGRPLDEAGERTRTKISASTPLGDLTISELKNYLDEIEARVGRLRPYLDSADRTERDGPGETSSPRFSTSPYRFAEEAKARDRSHDRNDDEAAEEVHDDDRPDDAEIRIVQNGEGATAPRTEGSDGVEKPDSIRLPLRGQVPVLSVSQDPDPGAAAGTMFRSVSETAGHGSGLLMWVCIAIVLLGFAAGFGYKRLHQAPAALPAVTVPAAVSGPTPEPAAQDAVLPETQDSASPEQTAGDLTSGAHSPQTGRGRARSGYQPGLLPREVRMEAEAARADSLGAKSQSGSTPAVRRDMMGQAQDTGSNPK